MSIETLQVIGSAANEITDGDCGALTLFASKGGLSIAAIVAALTEHGLDPAMAPAQQSAEDLLGSLCRSTADVITRHIGSGVYPADHPTHAGQRYTSRWRFAVAKSDARKLGDTLAEVGMVVDLVNGEPVMHHPAEANTRNSGLVLIGTNVVATFKARREAEILSARRVATWIRDTLTSQYKGCKMGTAVHTHPESRLDAKAFVTAIASTGWGEWHLPAVDYATNDDLRRSLARSFADQIADVRHEWELMRVQNAKRVNKKNADRAAKMKAAGETVPAHLTTEIDHTHRDAEITGKVATRLLKSLDEISNSAAGYAVLCGERAISEPRTLLRAMRTNLVALGGAEIRFSLLEYSSDDELAKEAAQADADRLANMSPIERKLREEHARLVADNPDIKIHHVALDSAIAAGQVTVDTPVEPEPELAPVVETQPEPTPARDPLDVTHYGRPPADGAVSRFQLLELD